jgi:hypothetical protein
MKELSAKIVRLRLMRVMQLRLTEVVRLRLPAWIVHSRLRETHLDPLERIMLLRCEAISRGRFLFSLFWRLVCNFDNLY